MNKTNLINIFKEGANEFQIIGYVCWWNVHNVEIMKDKLDQVLEACGIETKFARSHNYRSAFTRSLKELEENRIIRPVEEDRARIIYQFTAESKVEDVENPRLEYDPETIVTINKGIYRDTKDFAQSVFTKREDIKEKLIELFNIKKDSFHSSDITRMIQRILNSKADIVSLRNQGGVYYVPAQFENIINAVAQFVNSVGDSSFEFFPLPDVDACRQILASSIDNEMNVDLNKIDEDIEKVKSGEKEVTDKWRQHKMEQIEVIKNRVKMYSEVLSDKVSSNIINSLKSMETSLGSRNLDI